MNKSFEDKIKPLQAKFWDQEADTDLSTQEVISRYEKGFVGCIHDEESEEELLSSVEFPYAADAIHSYGFAESAKNSLVFPLKYVQEKYPKSFPGKAQVRGSCFPAGTAVTMADGSQKAIEQVSVGEYVISHRGIKQKVVDTIIAEEKSLLYLIKGQNNSNSLYCTKEHEIYVVQDKVSNKAIKKKAEDLTISDQLLVRLPQQNFSEASTKVESLQTVKYSGPVYCLTVENDSSFLANGYAVSNCVADSAALMSRCTMVLESVLGLPDEISGLVEEAPKVTPEAEKNNVVSFEPIYWHRNHGGDGWFCSAAVKVLQSKCGVVLRQNYSDVNIDLTQYSGRLAGRWGRSAPPSDIVDAFDNNLFRTATKVTAFEEARDLLNRGFFITTCGSQGWASARDDNGVSRRKGGWAHALTACGTDDRPEIVRIYNDPLVLVGNTWGPYNRDKKGLRKVYGTNHYIPDGFFWTTWSEFKNRQMYALSGLNGWARKELPDLSPGFV